MTRTSESIFILCCLVLLSTAPARANEHSDDHLDDDVGLLYSTQVHFGGRGIPLVTIGLMEKQKTVVLSSPDGLDISGQVTEQDQLVVKTLHGPPGSRWRFEMGEGSPGLVSFWCGVASIPFAQKEALSQALALWRERGEKVQVFEVGSVFGIRGHVIDNRTYILGIRSFEAERDAQAFAQQVFSKYGSRSFVHAHLDRRPSGLVKVIAPSGKIVETIFDLVKVRSRGQRPVTVYRVEYGQGYRWHGFENRNFAGTILLTPDRRGGLVVVNRVAVDRLLEGLVPAEIFPNAPMEALKAQAVVARGEVFAKLGTRHFLDPYLLCSTTHCQVYAGVKAETARGSRAVQATRGELLFLGPQLVDSVYSACCGGHSEDNDAVWSDPASPALRGRPDMDQEGRKRWQGLRGRFEEWLDEPHRAYCQYSSFAKKGLYRWSRTIPAKEMDALVAKTKAIGHVVSIQVLDRGVSGRVKVVRVVGTDGDLVVQREWPIRQLFGLIKSGMFIVKPITDAEQMVTGFLFKGGGWGHGVGLCQIGATGMAETGHDYREILAHYYGGARVFRLYGGSEL